MATATVLRNVEGKYRTSEETKNLASEIYARWGLSLSDAINVFLVKSVEVGGLPFEMRSSAPDYSTLSRLAHKAPIASDGIATLPADWDDYDE